MKRIYLSIIFIPLVFCLNHSLILADIVYFDDAFVEGRIISETKTSLVIQTFIGKVTLDKERISKIERTKPEEDFLKFGDYYFARGRYDEAIEYYKKSLEANPDFTKAKEALKTVQEAKRQQELIEKKRLESLRQERERAKEELKSKIGMAIDEVDGQFRITEIVEGSLADLAEIRPGDYLWSVEGHSTKNMTFKELHKRLIKTPTSFVIERRLHLIKKEFKYKNKTYVGLGLFLNEDKKGLVVAGVAKGAPADEAGLRYNDRIVKINDILTKDVSLDKVREIISNVELREINLVIRREVKAK